MTNPKQDSSTPHARGNALSSAVHEINNPLDALLNLLYMVESDAGLSEQSRQNLRMAEAEVARISHIARAAMKRFQRQEGAMEADVAELLASVLELHSAKLKSTEISVAQRYCDNARLVVYPELMRQVFNNLLLNAIDAMPNGGRLRAQVVSAHEWLGWKRTGLRITIADNGTGMAQEVFQRVREPFFTTKGAARERHGPSGCPRDYQSTFGRIQDSQLRHSRKSRNCDDSVHPFGSRSDVRRIVGVLEQVTCR
jgi:signal transduction histidine kinase